MCYCTIENVSKNYPHSNVLYALYASAQMYMKCGNNVLGANFNTMLSTTIGMAFTNVYSTFDHAVSWSMTLSCCFYFLFPFFTSTKRYPGHV